MLPPRPRPRVTARIATALPLAGVVRAGHAARCGRHSRSRAPTSMTCSSRPCAPPHPPAVPGPVQTLAIGAIARRDQAELHHAPLSAPARAVQLVMPRVIQPVTVYVSLIMTRPPARGAAARWASCGACCSTGRRGARSCPRASATWSTCAWRVGAPFALPLPSSSSPAARVWVVLTAVPPTGAAALISCLHAARAA